MATTNASKLGRAAFVAKQRGCRRGPRLGYVPTRMRFAALGSALVLTALAALAAVTLGGWGWIVVAAVLAAIALLGIHDVAQRRHSILRNYPILGHARFALEAVRPELQQYFIERNTDGRPFDRDSRTSIYERAKGIKDEQAYGTERDVREPGYEWLLQSMHPQDPPKNEPRITDRWPGLLPAVRDGAAERLGDVASAHCPAPR